jgi:phenylacetic acid degradation protein
MPVYSVDGFVPVVDPSTFVHPEAVLIGDVILGPHCYVGPGASLRGDFGRIVLHAGVNIQDCCVLHSFPAEDTLLEQDAHIGHAAVLHGCTIRRGALIGIGAIIMDGAVIEEEAFVGAASFVRAGFVVPKRTLVMGVPARIVRELTSAELAWKAEGTREYQDLAVRCLKTLKECQPLAAPEANRARLGVSTAVPLHTLNRGK